MKQLFLGAGVFCLLFAVIPLFFYGVFNQGVTALAVAGLFFLLLVYKWEDWARLRHILLPFMAVGLIGAAFLSMRMGEAGWRNQVTHQPVDGVVVLGGKIRGDQPTLVLGRRLDKAAAYLLENPQLPCVVTGGQGADEEYTEASIMAAYLERAGVAPHRILQEDQSVNTQQNLAFAAALLPEGTQSVVIVTDGFHQLRAGIYAKMAGLEGIALSSKTPWGLLPAYWVREWAAIGVAFVKSLAV
ncbi:YdcF family protein [Oscillospiraceae bacterium MB08-C2-2]|nr:YdcF family protein [Oscillospiraceae bacterium MB08-C2-2]